jgi:hypothetical protein
MLVGLKAKRGLRRMTSNTLQADAASTAERLPARAMLPSATSTN